MQLYGFELTFSKVTKTSKLIQVDAPIWKLGKYVLFFLLLLNLVFRYESYLFILVILTCLSIDCESQLWCYGKWISTFHFLPEFTL